jgi:hypothetical protein
MELTSSTWLDPEKTRVATPRATVTLAAALAVGVSTQALFWRTGFGLNFFVWTLLAVAACIASVRPRRITVAGYSALAATVLLGFSVFRFAGQWALTIAVPTDLAVLALLPLLLRDEVGLVGLSHLPLDALRALRGTRRAAREASSIPKEALGGRHGPMLGVLKGLAIGLPITGVFVLLLSADVDFHRLLARVGDKLGDATCFTGWSLLIAAGGLFAHALFKRPAVTTSVGPPPVPYRHGEISSPFRVRLLTPRVASSTWLMVIGQVALVFAVFVGVNLRSLFGGDALVRAPGSLTYAKYLHAGFGQLLFATVLSICLVVVGHRLLAPRDAETVFGAVPGGRLLVATECTLLGLTAVTVASCAQRLGIYEDAYGASRLRLGVAFVLLAVLLALALTMVKAARRGWRGYGGALGPLAVALAVLAASFNADAYVAQKNLDRASRGKALDVAYLASLSVDARAVLGHPVVQRSAALEAELRAVYCPDRSGVDWRAFRGIGSCSR